MLEGDIAGYWSISVNDQFRITFKSDLPAPRRFGSAIITEGDRARLWTPEGDGALQ